MYTSAPVPTWALLLGAFVLSGFVLGGVLLQTHNRCVREEAGVMAVYRDSQVQYDAFWKRVKESAQITEAYRDDFKAIFLGSMQSRYEGKDPALSFITEASPGLSPDVYRDLQRVVEGGRLDFAATQRTLVDRQRAYATTLQSWPTGPIAHALGYPRPVAGDDRPVRDRDGDGMTTVLDYDTVTSATTEAVFSTGHEDAPVSVF